MITYFYDLQTHPLSELKTHVLRHLKGLPSKVSMIGETNKIFRFEFPCEPIEPLSWLNNQTADTKIYWSERTNNFEVAGIKIVDSITEEGHVDTTKLFEYFEDRLSEDNINLRFYGGLSFQPNSLAKEWWPLGTCQFIVPRFEILRVENKTAFAVNLRVDEITEDKIKPAIEEFSAIDFSKETTYIKPPPRVQSRNDLPDKAAWTHTFRELFDSKGRIKLKKIVLARKSVFNFDRQINPVALIKHLKDRTPKCYHFCFQTSPSKAFIGASPERLYKKTGNELQSEAMAGTNPRGKTKEDDLKLQNELLDSAKNAREHQFVIDDLKAGFDKLCGHVNLGTKAQLLKLSNWQHLLTPFKGSLKSNIQQGTIMDSLHPTAATCGYPKEEALKTIKNLEPFDRGWYAGPIGYVGFDDSEFAVAIRSGLIENNTLSLYAGAGIVEGSTAENEWNEIENKISNFLSVFDYEQSYQPGA